MLSTSVVISIMKMVSNITITFIIRVFMFELFLANIVDFCLNSITFFISKLIIFIECSLKDSQTSSCNLHLCLHHNYSLSNQMSILYTFNTRREYVYLLSLWITLQD